MTTRSVAGLALVFLLLSALSAQPGKDDKSGKDDKKEAPKAPASSGFKDGRLDNENDKLTNAEHSDLRKLISGAEDAPTGERRKQIFEKACRWYIYRLTSPDVQEGRDPSGSSSQIMEEIIGGPGGIPPSRLALPISKNETDQEEMNRRRRQWGNAEVLRPIAIAHVEKVLELNSPIARINALRVLNRLAELNHENKGNEEVADVFIRVIENPAEHDAVRVWAFHGLGALFALQTSPNKNEQIKVKDPKRMDRALLAICRWLESRSKLDAGVVSQMRDDEKDGISYVRRMAVRALGNSRRPLAKDEKGVREGPVAQLLVKLIETDENSKASPPPGLSESVEAAVALCKLQSKLSPSYQPDFVAQALARFVADLGSRANDDVTRDSPLWRSYGLQLGLALADFKTDAPNERGGTYVKNACTQMENVLQNLMDSTKNKQAASELFNWVPANAAAVKGKDVYGTPAP